MRRGEARERVRRLAPWVAASLLVSSCAGPVYLHSPSLEQATAASASAMPDAATALKPFDDQLANLSAFAAREDLGVARYWSAVRDGEVARILAQRDPGVQRRLLGASVDRRLQSLGGSPGAPGGRSWLEVAALSRTARQAADARARIDVYLESFTRQYRELEVTEHPRDLRCATVLAEVPESERENPRGARTDLDRALRNLAGRCADRAASEGQSADLERLLKSTGGALAAEIGYAEIAEGVTADTLTAGDPDLARGIERAKTLSEEVKSAETFASERASAVRLEAFRATLADLWKTGSIATKLAGLDALDKSIDAWLQAGLCGSPSVAADVKKDAGCDKPAESRTAAAGKGFWSLAVALTALSDANASEARSVQWLAAAKAIIAAERAKVALQVEQAKAEAAARRQRIGLMLGELSYLAQAKHMLVASAPACRGGAPVGVSGSNFQCGFAAYVDAWNEGRVPGEVMYYRPFQLERTYIVRRARATAEKQHALAQAGTATLKAYGAGGLRPEEIGQLLFDLSVVGILGGREL